MCRTTASSKNLIDTLLYILITVYVCDRIFRSTTLFDAGPRPVALHDLVDRPDLRAIAKPKRLGEPGAVVGIDRGAGAGAGDGDIGGAGIDGVGAERLQMGDNMGRRRPLGRMDGADPAGADVAVGEGRRE